MRLNLIQDKTLRTIVASLQQQGYVIEGETEREIRLSAVSATLESAREQALVREEALHGNPTR